MMPFGLCVYLHYWRFLCVWMLYVGTTGYHVHQATRNPLPVTAPRRVYKWFVGMYKLCYFMGVAGYGSILFDFFGFRAALGLPKQIAPFGSLVLFYGLYFGVLVRDSAEMCADRIQQRLGVRCSYVILPKGLYGCVKLDSVTLDHALPYVFLRVTPRAWLTFYIPLSLCPLFISILKRETMTHSVSFPTTSVRSAVSICGPPTVRIYMPCLSFSVLPSLAFLPSSCVTLMRGS